MAHLPLAQELLQAAGSFEPALVPEEAVVRSLPEHDEPPAVRQKRKRTSPDDQAVLEEAFNRDCKPDKAARLDIVRKVALSEKEVQIWFQNRRQSSRRKSRPLMMHEVVQYHLARSNSATTQRSSSSSDAADLSGSQDQSFQEIVDASQDSLAADQANPADASSDLTAADAPPSSSATSAFSERRIFSQPSMTFGDSAQREGSTDQPSSNHVGYLANRRSAPSLRKSLSSHESTIPSLMPSQRRLNKSKSLIRLSMTSDGSAEIKAAASPSPPRPLPTVTTILTATDLTAPIRPLSFTSSHRLNRSSSGRSRDSRSWEFWCDKESRNELEHAAEQDMNGSAAGAISLFRSASRRAALGVLSASAIGSSSNTASPSTHANPTASKPHRRRRPVPSGVLARSHTAQGRLQNGPKPVAATLAKPKSRPLPPLEKGLTSGGGRDDSDKENVDPELDPELAAFMGSGGGGGVDRASSRVAASADEELDCVQGLLSLSQGHWQR